MDTIWQYFTEIFGVKMKKIVLSANTAWSIYNFRYGLVKKLIDLDYQVVIIAPHDEYGDKLKEMGCEVFHIDINGKSTNPLDDLKTFWQYWKLYKKIDPDLIFHYTIKPNIYGTLAAKLNGIRSIAITTGLGYAYINENLITKVVKGLYRFSLRYAEQVWFLNTDDAEVFKRYDLVDESKMLILPGEGIDTSKFQPMNAKKRDDTFRFLLVARMLWDKGIEEYVEAAKNIKQRYSNVEFLLLGAIGVDNPTAIPKEIIENWEEEGIVQYLGTTDNVKNEIAKADCIVLPSYREGTSRVLLESASMAKPIVTTDVPGCREVVDDGVNGFLCKMKDAQSLAKQMERMLILREEERVKMGYAGRKKVTAEFDEQIVIEEYLQTMKEL